MNIAIPSYRRATLLREKTLAYLERIGITPAEVSIFVANKTELDDYTVELPAYADRLFITGAGLRQSRRIAHERYLDEGAEILWMDDDVASLQARVNDKTVEEVTNLSGLADEGFALCRKVGAHLWGIYPTVNAFYMKPKVRTDLRHIVGSCYGVINRRDPELLNLEYGDAKEDYERTLRHYERDGHVVRFDWVGPKTAYYRGDTGGITDRTPESVEENVLGLLGRWPGWVKRNPRRKSGYPEILIKA